MFQLEMLFFYKVNDTVYRFTLQFTTLQIQDTHAYVSIEIAWNLCESLGESRVHIYYIYATHVSVFSQLLIKC